MNENEVINVLAEAMITIGNYLKDESPFDKTVEGTIKQITTEGYQVELLGSLYTIKDKTTYTVGTKVWITIPCNNFSDMFILKERSD